MDNDLHQPHIWSGHLLTHGPAGMKNTQDILSLSVSVNQTIAQQSAQLETRRHALHDLLQDVEQKVGSSQMPVRHLLAAASLLGGPSPWGRWYILTAGERQGVQECGSLMHCSSPCLTVGPNDFESLPQGCERFAIRFTSMGVRGQMRRDEQCVKPLQIPRPCPLTVPLLTIICGTLR